MGLLSIISSPLRTVASMYRRRDHEVGHGISFSNFAPAAPRLSNSGTSTYLSSVIAVIVLELGLLRRTRPLFPG